MQNFVLTDSYNGMIYALFFASGIFILSMTAMFKKYMTRFVLTKAIIGGCIPLIVAFTKFVFHEKIDVHLGWPWWFSPSLDIFATLLIAWIFLRLWYWSRKY